MGASPLHRQLARLLTGGGPDTPSADAILEALTAGQLSGDDALLLSGLALRRLGGSPWQRFRQSTAELAQAAGASGGALRVVNRLEGARAVV